MHVTLRRLDSFGCRFWTSKNGMQHQVWPSKREELMTYQPLGDSRGVNPNQSSLDELKEIGSHDEIRQQTGKPVTQDSLIAIRI